MRRRTLKRMEPPVTKDPQPVYISTTWSFRKFYLQLQSAADNELNALQTDLNDFYSQVK